MKELYRLKTGKGIFGLNGTTLVTDNLLLIRKAPESTIISIEKIIIGGVEYTYVKRNQLGTKDVPVLFDEAVGGIINDVDENDNPIQLRENLIYNAGTPSDRHSWWQGEVRELKTAN